MKSPCSGAGGLIHDTRDTPEDVERMKIDYGIRMALCTLYGKKLAGEWQDLPNSNLLFQGQTPREFMAAQGLDGARKVFRLLASRCV